MPGPRESTEQVIHHCVFLDFRTDCDRRERDDILASLARLVDEIPGLLSLTFGPNADFEGKSQKYSDGFVAVFVDRESLALYATHPDHLELGRKLTANCVDGSEGIIVFDVVSS